MITVWKGSSCSVIALFMVSQVCVSQYAFSHSISGKQIETAPGLRTSTDQTPADALDGDRDDVNDVQNASNTPEKLPDANKKRHIPNASNQEDTIVVTGSNIRGGSSAGSRLDVFTEDDINASGYATLGQFMQTYAQNFPGGNSEDTFDRQSQGNITSGTGINLRGLGNSSTLVLLNGRRLPSAGLDASFADVASIPASAIERVEILTDGGSAIYGTDAIAGVVNIILRKEYDGAETRARIGTVTKGSLQEYQLSQTAGTHWSDGHGLIVYEYYRREPLDRADRPFSNNADLSSRGGNDYRSTYGNPGNILDPETFTPAYAIPAGQDGTSLSPSDLIANQVNRMNQWAFGTLLPLQDKHSVFAYIEQSIAESISVGFEGRYVRRKFKNEFASATTVLVVPSRNPFFVDPFGNSDFLYVQYDLTPDLGPRISNGKVKSRNVTASAAVDLAYDLQIRAYASHSKEVSENRVDDVDWSRLDQLLEDTDPDIAFNPFGEGANKDKRSIVSIRSWTSSKTDFGIGTLNVVMDGSIFDPGSGNIRFAIGGDYQDIDFEVLQKSAIAPARQGNVNRTVKALFGEIYVPILARPEMKVLDLSAALRYDKYSDFGGTWNPKIGLRWAPSPLISLRGTWGTSFRAPNVAYLNERGNFYSAYDVPDPRNPAKNITILYKSGGNSQISEETSDSWTLGATLSLTDSDSVILTVDYFNIRFKDRIQLLDDPRLIVSDQSTYADFGILDPTASDIVQFCSDDYTFVATDPSVCTGAIPIGLLADLRYQNFAKTHIDGLDVKLDYSLALSGGSSLLFSANISYIFNLKEAVTDAALLEERIDTFGYPTDFRARGSIGWINRSGTNFTIFVNYADRYKDRTNHPFLDISDHLTFDLSLSSSLPEGSGRSFLHGTTFMLNIINIFANNPPFVNSPSAAYDASNTDPLGRFIAISIIKKW